MQPTERTAELTLVQPINRPQEGKRVRMCCKASRLDLKARLCV